MIPIDVERTRNALQTKYSRTVASGGIVAVSWKWTTQAQLNALLAKATEVFVGNVNIHWDSSNSVNTWSETYIDFAVANIVTINRTNLGMLASQLYSPWTCFMEFSDMTYAVTGSGLAYKHAIGWKFTFQ